MPRPSTLAMTSGLTSSAASPASAIATSVPFGLAPLTAMWNGMLARVGSSGPVEATMSKPDMGNSMEVRQAPPPHPAGLRPATFPTSGEAGDLPHVGGGPLYE